MTISNRMILLLFIFGWVAVAASGIARADDDDDDDDDDSGSSNSDTSSIVIDVWPSADLAWPPRLADAGIGANSGVTPPIVLPDEWRPDAVSSLPTAPPERNAPPIVPVTTDIAP